MMFLMDKLIDEYQVQMISSFFLNSVLMNELEVVHICPMNNEY
jgi:hypothetical protein